MKARFKHHSGTQSIRVTVQRDAAETNFTLTVFFTDSQSLAFGLRSILSPAVLSSCHKRHFQITGETVLVVNFHVLPFLS